AARASSNRLLSLRTTPTLLQAFARISRYWGGWGSSATSLREISTARSRPFSASGDRARSHSRLLRTVRSPARARRKAASRGKAFSELPPRGEGRGVGGRRLLGGPVFVEQHAQVVVGRAQFLPVVGRPGKLVRHPLLHRQRPPVELLRLRKRPALPQQVGQVV